MDCQGRIHTKGYKLFLISTKINKKLIIEVADKNMDLTKSKFILEIVKTIEQINFYSNVLRSN